MAFVEKIRRGVSEFFECGEIGITSEMKDVALDFLIIDFLPLIRNGECIRLTEPPLAAEEVVRWRSFKVSVIDTGVITDPRVRRRWSDRFNRLTELLSDRLKWLLINR